MTFNGFTGKETIQLGVLCFILSACGTTFPLTIGPKKVAEDRVCAEDDIVCHSVIIADDTTFRPKYRLGTTGSNQAGAATAENLDGSTAAEIAAATAVTPSQGERKLGTTVASLGDVSVPGFWLQTALVDKVVKGRVVWAENGNSVLVELRPKDGEKTGGSQISLPAMRALGVPLTALPELIVFQE